MLKFDYKGIPAITSNIMAKSDENTLSSYALRTFSGLTEVSDILSAHGLDDPLYARSNTAASRVSSSEICDLVAGNIRHSMESDPVVIKFLLHNAGFDDFSGIDESHGKHLDPIEEGDKLEQSNSQCFSPKLSNVMESRNSGWRQQQHFVPVSESTPPPSPLVEPKKRNVFTSIFSRCFHSHERT
jgi:hypothetical protein